MQSFKRSKCLLWTNNGEQREAKWMRGSIWIRGLKWSGLALGPFWGITASECLSHRRSSRKGNGSLGEMSTCVEFRLIRASPSLRKVVGVGAWAAAFFLDAGFSVANFWQCVFCSQVGGFILLCEFVSLFCSWLFDDNNNNAGHSNIFLFFSSMYWGPQMSLFVTS